MLRRLLAKESYNDTILPDFDMISNGSCFDDAVGANMDIIANLHWIVVERAPVRFIRRPVIMDMTLSLRGELSVRTS